MGNIRECIWMEEKMERLSDVAYYLIQEYSKVYGDEMSEMKLHKLLYLVQREAYIQTGRPLFRATFYGWKYGPVLKEIRNDYHEMISGSRFHSFQNNPETKHIIDNVLRLYAGKDAWSLSRLTHGEYSWQQSRRGIAETDNSDIPIRDQDIIVDAQRIKERRDLLQRLGLA